MLALIANAIAAPADPTNPAVALVIARHFLTDNDQSAAATRLALTWGALSPEAARAEGFRYVTGLAEEIAEEPADEAARALEWARQYVALPAPGVTLGDFLLVQGEDFAERKAIAAQRGRPYIAIEVSPHGWSATIQTADGLCEPGSPLAAQHDPDGWLQNACRNLNRQIQENLPRLLAADGVTQDEWQEWQEDVRVAQAAQRLQEMDDQGRFYWET